MGWVANITDANTRSGAGPDGGVETPPHIAHLINQQTGEEPQKPEYVLKRGEGDLADLEDDNHGVV